MIPYPESDSPPITGMEKMAGLAAGLGLAMLAVRKLRKHPPAVS